MINAIKFIFPGILVGAALSLFCWGSLPAPEVYPEWTGAIKTIDKTETSPFLIPDPGLRFPVRYAEGYYLLEANGAVSSHSPVKEGFFTMSGNGRYYTAFQKVGRTVDFYDARGEGYWKLKSQEYPYMSRNGKLILLMNGDHSRVRFFDLNGNEIGDKRVSGRMCTAISFSEKNDFGAVGFLTGTYYIISPLGKILHRGKVPEGSVVKSIGVAGNGAFAAVHYGDTARDMLRIIDVKDGDFDEASLKDVHQVKTSLHVSGSGRVVIFERDSLTCFKPSGRERFRLPIQQKRAGTAGICLEGDVYSAAYTKSNGEARFVMVRDDGVILMARDYPSESFLDPFVEKGLIFLRGSDNLYCYRLQR